MKFTKVQDVMAFTNIRNRLTGEVGSIIDLVTDTWMSGDKSKYFGRGGYPYWGLIRMTMPVAESIGGLLYDNESPVKNLEDIFSSGYLSHPNYKNLKSILIMLYRHPLIHTDEMRGIKVDKTNIAWSLTASDGMKHLQVSKYKDRRSTYEIHFCPRVFYENLVTLLDNLISEANNGMWEGEVGKRYSKWRRINLNDPGEKRVSKKLIKNVKKEKTMLNNLSKSFV